MRTRLFAIIRDEEEIELEVDFLVTTWGAPASWTDPAEGAEIEIDEVLGPDGYPIEVTEEERDKFEVEILENIEDYYPSEDDH